MAPSLALLGVPSRSSIVWSTSRWSSASRPIDRRGDLVDDAVDGLLRRPCRRSACRRRAARPPRTRRWRRRWARPPGRTRRRRGAPRPRRWGCRASRGSRGRRRLRWMPRCCSWRGTSGVGTVSLAAYGVPTSPGCLAATLRGCRPPTQAPHLRTASRRSSTTDTARTPAAPAIRRSPARVRAGSPRRAAAPGADRPLRESRRCLRGYDGRRARRGRRAPSSGEPTPAPGSAGSAFIRRRIRGRPASQRDARSPGVPRVRAGARCRRRAAGRHAPAVRPSVL